MSEKIPEEPLKKYVLPVIEQDDASSQQDEEETSASEFIHRYFSG